MERVLEREYELTVLARAVRDLDVGRGYFFLVGGEAGIGKTTLVRELRSQVDGEVEFSSRSMRAAVGAGSPGPVAGAGRGGG